MYNDGFIMGNGAALNINLGYVPSWVKLLNITDTNVIAEGPVAEMLGFDSGSIDFKPGMRIDASDSGWGGIVGQEIRTGGNPTTGNSAGLIVFEAGTLYGGANIADNDQIYASEQVDVAGTTNVGDVVNALLRGVTLEMKPEESTAGDRMSILAFASGIQPYYGTVGGEALGFTIPAGLAADNKLLGYQAWSPAQGAGPVDQSV